MFCIDLTVPIEMYLRCMSTCKILFLFQRSQFPILYILVHCMCKRLMIKFWDLILTNSDYVHVQFTYAGPCPKYFILTCL